VIKATPNTAQPVMLLIFLKFHSRKVIRYPVNRYLYEKKKKWCTALGLAKLETLNLKPN
jgi:hypothetical protein